VGQRVEPKKSIIGQLSDLLVDAGLSESISWQAESESEFTRLVDSLPDTQTEVRNFARTHRVETGVLVEILLAHAAEVIRDRQRMGVVFSPHLSSARTALTLVHELESLEEAESRTAYIDSLEHSAEALEFDQWIQSFELEHQRTPTRREHAAIFCLVHGDGERDFMVVRRDAALDVVLHKMIGRWLEFGAEESLTDFFANRLQLVNGYKNQSISRDKIRILLNRMAERYSPDSPQAELRTSVAKMWLPNCPTPLFIFDGQPWGDFLRKARRQRRKNPVSLKRIFGWICDECCSRHDPGTAPEDVIPQRPSRSDSRLSVGKDSAATRYMGQILELPTSGWAGDCLMCSCWQTKAGILRPEFEDNV
jgi:hypothetical protein